MRARRLPDWRLRPPEREGLNRKQTVRVFPDPQRSPAITAGERAEGLDRIFVAVLGMDRFADAEVDGLSAYLNLLPLQAGKVHLDPVALTIEEGVMLELLGMKVGVKVTVDAGQQIVAGSIGAVSGAASGGGIVFNQAVNTATQQGNQMLAQHMILISDDLMPLAPASLPTIHAIQSRITQAMGEHGLRAANIAAWSSAITLISTEVGEELANPYNYPSSRSIK